MPKHSHSSSSSSSSNHKKHKIKSICSDCSSNSSGNDYLDISCKDYFLSENLIHTNIITELDVNEYLKLRKTKFAELDKYEIKKDEEDCIVINPSDNTIKINNTLIQSKNITISKYIANGCYGVIFVSSDDEDITYVIKFIIDNDKNENEITTMINIKQNNNTYIPNFINIAYYHLNCRKISNTGNKLLDGIKKCLKNNYSMIILEYFDGTIFDLINSLFPLFPPNKRNFNQIEIDTINSIFAQLIISIYLFHTKFNYFHNDAHLKNFLYKKVNNNDNKYYHYKVGDKDYYIKNCGYVIVLSDYGLSTSIIRTDDNEYKKKSLKDYEDILNKISLYLRKILIGDNIEQFTHYKDMSNNKNKTYFSSFDELAFLDFMMNFLNIKTAKTVDMILINDIPYH